MLLKFHAEGIDKAPRVNNTSQQKSDDRSGRRFFFVCFLPDHISDDSVHAEDGDE